MACCWRAPEGDFFGVTCFTPEGERVWRLRNLTHDARGVNRAPLLVLAGPGRELGTQYRCADRNSGQ